jgi:hypothetical protein
MQNMPPELQKYYEDRFAMMTHEGWRDLLEDIDLMIMSLNNVATIQDEKDLQFKKGELSILNWLKTLKQVIEEAYEALDEKDI